MDERISILCIAPYESIKNQMISAAKQYPQIDLTIFIGDLEDGLKIARQNFHGDYDVVISRGGTANMLKKNLRLPVIEIPVSTYDLLYSLKLAGGFDGHVAIICNESMAQNAQRLNELMQLDVDIITYNQEKKAQFVISQIDSSAYQTLLCDNNAYVSAKIMGMNAFLICSSIQNIYRALDQAVMLAQSQSRLREENIFLRKLLHNQVSYTMIFNKDGSLYLSTMDMPTPDVLEMFRQELHEALKQSERKVIRMLNGRLYNIRMKTINMGGSEFVAVFFYVRKASLGTNHIGIRFDTRPEVENRYCDSVFSISEIPSDLHKEITHIAGNTAPVLISGEPGTGKQSAVDLIYLHSMLTNYPLINVDCAVLNEQEWTFLLENHNSPLADENNTISFTNVDEMSENNRSRLISTLIDSQACVRNRVFFSCCTKNESISHAGHIILDALCCISLYIPPLRKIKNRIPKMLNASLSKDASNLHAPVLGAEPRALELLMDYDWPQNNLQFRRIVKELAIASDSQFITADSVHKILRKERNIAIISPNTEHAVVPLDLNRPMEDINRDIALRVLNEKEGNHSATAKQLGISRTTLWRILQKM